MSGPISWPAGAIPLGADPHTLVRLKNGIAPGDETVVACDFTGPLAAVDCDTIASTCTPAVSIIRNDGGPADLYSLGTPTINDEWDHVVVRLGAPDTPGFEYLVSVTVLSSDSQRLTRSFLIACTIR